MLALPRGGVPVGGVVASALAAPLQDFVARKLGAPGHPEVSIGGIAEGSDEVVVTNAATRLSLSEDDLADLTEEERAELARRGWTFRGNRPLTMQGRDVLLLDGLFWRHDGFPRSGRPSDCLWAISGPAQEQRPPRRRRRVISAGRRPWFAKGGRRPHLAGSVLADVTAPTC